MGYSFIIRVGIQTQPGENLLELYNQIRLRKQELREMYNTFYERTYIGIVDRNIDIDDEDSYFSLTTLFPNITFGFYIIHWDMISLTIVSVKNGVLISHYDHIMETYNYIEFKHICARLEYEYTTNYLIEGEITRLINPMSDKLWVPKHSSHKCITHMIPKVTDNYWAIRVTMCDEEELPLRGREDGVVAEMRGIYKHLSEDFPKFNVQHYTERPGLFHLISQLKRFTIQFPEIRFIFCYIYKGGYKMKTIHIKGNTTNKIIEFPMSSVYFGQYSRYYIMYGTCMVLYPDITSGITGMEDGLDSYDGQEFYLQT